MEAYLASQSPSIASQLPCRPLPLPPRPLHPLRPASEFCMAPLRRSPEPEYPAPLQQIAGETASDCEEAQTALWVDSLKANCAESRETSTLVVFSTLLLAW